MWADHFWPNSPLLKSWFKRDIDKDCEQIYKYVVNSCYWDFCVSFELITEKNL